jgi:glycosyltransferase involved in cell wall biosynthesis
VVTLHDVLHLDLPALVPRRVRLFRRLAYDRPALHADRLVVPSVFVRDRAIARLGADPSRIRVIHHAVDTSVFHPGETVERESYVLYPARFWPHKNHARLFEAFRAVRRLRPELELVLTGGGHSGLRLETGVRSLGLVTRDELALLYRRASAVVFPSLYEGFGLPVLEAMASGCPVAAASGTAVGEVAGDAVLYFPPDNATDMAAAILAAIDQTADLTQRGLVASASFSWQEVARLHDDVYAELE